MIRSLILICLAMLAPAAAGSPRESLSFNSGWKFKLGDHAAAREAAFDDSKWEETGVPHSFSLPYFASPEFYTGYGWYRKEWNVPESWAGKRVNLEFDGVFQVAEVFVNGKRVGEHRGGYTGFYFDVTDAVVRGRNVVAVRVNNLWDPRLAPRAGEHTFSGGIYRNVRMVVTSPLHVAWYGTFVTTPEVSKESAKVNVKTEVVNHSGKAVAAVLKTVIIDPDGKPVAEMSSRSEIAAGATLVFDQTSDPLANPRLWHPHHPDLYQVRSYLSDAAVPADEFISPLGFRWFKFTADQGFFLNGEHFYFRGANAHQDHAGWGDAVTDRGFHRDVKMIKDAGFDFIRGSHYPHAPAFSKACDEQGMLFWSENAFWGTAGFKHDWSASAYPPEPEHQEAFDQSVKDSLREMIRIHRNHPSIVIWGMDNEVFFTDGSTMPRVRELLKQTAALSRELDPTRPVGIGGCQRGEIDKLGDVAGYNGDGARLFINPGIPSIVTEYGSTMADRPGEYAPGWGDLQQERFPWRSGEAIWCAFDHGSIAGRKFGGMGMIDYFRLPKRQWYWYRNAYKNIPPPEWPAAGTPAALKLETDRGTLESTDGTDDALLVVTVVDAAGKQISQSPPVRLTIESGPGEFPTGRSISFAADSDIVIRDGQAAMSFRSWHGGKSVIRATSPGLKDATIEILSRGGPEFVEGVTPLVKDRPYVCFTSAPSGNAASRFGVGNPTRASSEADGHAGGLANDDKADTFWQPVPSDGSPWLQIDLERIVALRETKLVFPDDGERGYRIEVSENGTGPWALVADRSAAPVKERECSDIAAAGSKGRFLRVSFASGQKVSVAEFTARGIVE